VVDRHHPGDEHTATANTPQSFFASPPEAR
jgi:hypothetical protein